jgi:lipid A ethanolaminephosphotransferase
MFMAPDTQRQVPFLMRLSESFATTMGIDAQCLAQKTALRQSHDVLFHSVLGLLDIRTAVRDPALDLVANCRPTKDGA